MDDTLIIGAVVIGGYLLLRNNIALGAGAAGANNAQFNPYTNPQTGAVIAAGRPVFYAKSHFPGVIVPKHVSGPHTNLIVSGTKQLRTVNNSIQGAGPSGTGTSIKGVAAQGGNTSGWADAAKLGVTGATIGSAGGPLGAAIGGGIGAIVGGVGDLLGAW